MRCSRVRADIAGRRSLRGLAHRFRRNSDGATAIEFAAVSIPFLMFIFGLIGMALNFFIQNSIENGMARSARLIRTGEAQAQNMKVKDFKNSICDKAGVWVKCASLQVFVDKYASWDAVQPEPCLDSNGNAKVSTVNGDSLIAQYSGTSSDIVIVTGCYKWNFTSSLPFLHVGNMQDKSLMMQSMTAFRSEPYTPPVSP